MKPTLKPPQMLLSVIRADLLHRADDRGGVPLRHDPGGGPGETFAERDFTVVVHMRYLAGFSISIAACLFGTILGEGGSRRGTCRDSLDET